MSCAASRNMLQLHCCCRCLLWMMRERPSSSLTPSMAQKQRTARAVDGVLQLLRWSQSILLFAGLRHENIPRWHHPFVPIATGNLASLTLGLGSLRWRENSSEAKLVLGIWSLELMNFNEPKNSTPTIISWIHGFEFHVFFWFQATNWTQLRVASIVSPNVTYPIHPSTAKCPPVAQLCQPWSRLNARNMLNFERYRKPKEPW